jgi:hypothetical protein
MLYCRGGVSPPVLVAVQFVKTRRSIYFLQKLWYNTTTKGTLIYGKAVILHEKVYNIIFVGYIRVGNVSIL